MSSDNESNGNQLDALMASFSDEEMKDLSALLEESKSDDEAKNQFCQQCAAAKLHYVCCTDLLVYLAWTWRKRRKIKFGVALGLGRQRTRIVTLLAPTSASWRITSLGRHLSTMRPISRCASVCP